MSFFSGLLDFVGAVAGSAAKNIDRMSDSEIQRKFSPDKSVEEYRDFAAKAHDFAQSRKKENS